MSMLLHQLRFEQRVFWRSREAAVFIFVFPLLLYALLGSVYGDEIDGVPAVGRAARRSLRLRRGEHGLRGARDHPRRPARGGRAQAAALDAAAAAVYLAAVLLSTLVTFALQSVACSSLGGLAFDASMPANWLGFAGAIVLGVACFAGLGLAAASLIRSAEGVSAVVNVVILPMAFLSGAFGPTRDFPAVLQAIADVLPLTYFIDIVDGVYLDGDSLFADPKALAIVLAWGARGRRRRPAALRLDAPRALSASGYRAARGSTGAPRPRRARRRRTSRRRPSASPAPPVASFEATSPRSPELPLRATRSVELDRQRHELEQHRDPVERDRDVDEAEDVEEDPAEQEEHPDVRGELDGREHGAAEPEERICLRVLDRVADLVRADRCRCD